MTSADKARILMNRYGKEKIHFLFIIDFALQNPLILRMDELTDNQILFDIQGITNHPHHQSLNKTIEFKKFPVPFETYHSAFQVVQRHLNEGDTYLINLTFPTRIECNLSLSELFHASSTKFKLLYRDQFVVFSPEIFVRIEDGRIASFPMKGTIDASLTNAEEQILNDKKEQAEHTTIVDLIRNDLNMVAKRVRVENYRYIDLIRSNQKDLLQVSSKISGELEPGYGERIGDILFQLLPAGSISGAPKKKTVEIIQAVENYDRGYYTGVFGYFDGTRLESGVMIRFIENVNGELYYKSGGGITASSEVHSEYMELIDKVYVPLA
jgi:para-aminobenzoate synthetase component 1